MTKSEAEVLRAACRLVNEFGKHAIPNAIRRGWKAYNLGDGQSCLLWKNVAIALDKYEDQLAYERG